MTQEEMRDALKSELDVFQKSLSQYASKEDIKQKFEDFEKRLGELNMTEKLNELTDAVEKQGLAMNKIVVASESKTKTVLGQIKDQQETVKAVLKGDREKEFTIKALTTRASAADNTEGWMLPDIGQLATAERNAIAIFPTLQITDQDISNGYIKYMDWDADTIARAAAMKAEGASFPESTAAWVMKTLPIQKIGDTLIMTEEFREDLPALARELEMFLETNVAIVENNQIVNGNGTAPNLVGLVTAVEAYVAVAQGITDASIYDLIVDARKTIAATGSGKYRPDFVLMNITDIQAYKLKKDANNNYIMPPFYDREGNKIDGMFVIEDNTVTANTMFVGDHRFARVYVRSGYQIAYNYQGTQFVEDKLTLKARKRLAFLIREADKSGFRKVTDIAAALVTLKS